jgi:hypothetical protein
VSSTSRSRRSPRRSFRGHDGGRGLRRLAVERVDGALAGLAGKLAIRIADGKHHYDLESTLPER